MKSLMKRKLLWNTQAPPDCNIIQTILPSITAVFTVVQNLWHTHSQKHPAKRSQLTQDVLLQISNLLLLPLCVLQA